MTMKIQMKSTIMALGFGLMLPLDAEHAAESLTWKNFDKVAEYARQKKGEKLYQEVTWHSSVIDAQRVATAADKPILLWLYFGDPRMNC